MRSHLRLLAIAIVGMVLGAARAPQIMAYHDSWRERAGVDPATTTLANTPTYVDLLALAFAKPDMTYAGGDDLSGTGLQYPFGADTLRRAIALLKRRSPGVRVVVSVGGAAYRDWDRLDAAAVARLVRTLGADGVDMDYETADPGCARRLDGQIACRAAAAYLADLMRLRGALPRPYLLSVTAVSTGAYGEGRLRDARPAGGRYVGAMLGLFRSPQAQAMDLVSIDAYDAGASFDPLQAFHAYRAVWKGPLLLGVEVRLPGADGPIYDMQGVETLARAVAHDPLGGIMVYPMLEQPSGFATSPTHPNGLLLLQAACPRISSQGLRLRLDASIDVGYCTPA